MSHQFETGHAKNVANFEKLIEQIKTYSAYNPSIDNLKIPQLEALYASALTNLNNVKTKRIANKNAIAERHTLYDSLKPKTTRVINQLDVLGLNETTINQAKSLNREIQGYSKKPTKPEGEEGENPITRSTSRQSYTQTAENFSKLLELLATITSYNPNTEDLKLTSLTTYHTSLVDATQQVNMSEAELTTSMIERNTLLYDDATGLYEVALRVKKYVKSVYGATAPEYKSISKIRFTEGNH